MFEFSEEIAHRLKELRKANRITQAEVAQRIGMSAKYGHSYIARLEDHQIKNPYITTILNYLDAIGVNWGTFFGQLSAEQDKLEHKKVMSQVKLPPDPKIQARLDRDVRLYEAKIKPPINYYPEVDMERVKQKIEDKVRKYLQTLRVKDELIPHYLKFAQEVITVDKYKPVLDKYAIAGVSDYYLIRIQNIAVRTLHNEEEKIKKQKPLQTEKRRSMAIKYLQSRVKLAPIEKLANDLLVENNLANSAYYAGYMNFARECYRVYKDYYHKDQLLINQELSGLTDNYAQLGLNEEIMKQIKQAVQKYYEPIKTV